jgi:predicted DNA-binding protein
MRTKQEGTKAVNLRLPAETHRQLLALCQQLGMTQVQVMILAVEHLAHIKAPRKGKP